MHRQGDGPAQDRHLQKIERPTISGPGIAWRKPVNELYPNDRIIQLAIQKGIRLTTASDAYSHAQLGENFERLADKMSILGARKMCVYAKHKRIEHDV